MSIIESNKETNVSCINCYGSFKVKLTLKAKPKIFFCSNDIVIVIDRLSGLMMNTLVNLKKGVEKFIDIIGELTEDENGDIGNGYRIAIANSSVNTAVDTNLITSVDDLKTAIRSLNGGCGNYGDAFLQAVQLLKTSKSENKTIIMFTDGKMTTSFNSNSISETARSQGIKICRIDLSSTGGIDENAIKICMPYTSPDLDCTMPCGENFDGLFETLAFNFLRPGATCIKIIEKVNSCFKITDFTTPTKGTAAITGKDSLKWEIDKLGEKRVETAVLEFTVKHIGPCSGKVCVNDSIFYCDKENNDVHFPNPKIDIDCGIEVLPEPCPEPISIEIDRCKDSIIFDAEKINMESLGRILQINVTIKDVCANRRVALAVLLYELDCNNTEYKRGIKTMTIPAHNSPICRDVNVKCIKFVLPEDLDVLCCPNNSICNKRRFIARFISHYIDFDFHCCNIAPTSEIIVE